MAWLGTWAQRVKVTTDSGDVTANLTDFPVVIHLSANCGKDGQDLTPVFDVLGANDKKIAVTSDDGVTQLYVEVEEWDSVGEEAWLHSKFSSILAASDSDFYLYYDVGQADNNTYVGDPNSATAENVWDASFKLVSHMLDDPDNANIRDSTSNDADGAKTGAAVPAVTAAGAISDAQSFNGTTSKIDFGTEVWDEAGKSFVIECWVKDGGGHGDRFFARGTDNNNYFWMYTSTPAGTMLIYVDSKAGGVNMFPTLTGTTDVNDGAWHHVAFIREFGGTDKLYVDGNLDDSDVDASNANNLAGTLRLGARPAAWGDAFYEGDLDEVRVSENTIRSVAWITASYETGRDDFLSYGSAELMPVTEVVGIYPPDSWKRRRFSEDHLLNIQVRRPVIDLGIISADMRRLVSESMVIDASVRRQIQERLVASGRVYTTRELHELVDDVITLLLLEQVDNIGG